MSTEQFLHIRDLRDIPGADGIARPGSFGSLVDGGLKFPLGTGLEDGADGAPQAQAQ